MATGFIIKTVVIDGAEQVYSVYIPKDYDPKKAWPLVMFLHGIGERGSDGLLQTEVGIGRAIRRWPERFPCIVIMPQCPTTKTWGSDIELIDQSMQITREECNIDPDRIYLTGLSMGGFGTWMYGAKHPDFFAALLPICGGGKTAAAPILAKLPIWAFHGLDDTTVPPKMSQEMVEAVRKAGGDVRYTEYPGVGHNSWDNAYADPEVVAWMLQQKRAH
ncbi:MAG: hypothetical protein QG656_1412 [Candidatus Hydrogenedentes bacterium]|nr:hypothetical protein [Candidatus Hydrogenedentota bacterium]